MFVLIVVCVLRLLALSDVYCTCCFVVIAVTLLACFDCGCWFVFLRLAFLIACDARSGYFVGVWSACAVYLFISLVWCFGWFGYLVLDYVLLIGLIVV